MVPFWVSIVIRHLLSRVPKRDHNFDNHPYVDIWTSYVSICVYPKYLLFGIPGLRRGQKILQAAGFLG